MYAFIADAPLPREGVGLGYAPTEKVLYKVASEPILDLVHFSGCIMSLLQSSMAFHDAA
jgi:hypothetical protein